MPFPEPGGPSKIALMPSELPVEAGAGAASAGAITRLMNLVQYSVHRRSQSTPHSSLETPKWIDRG